MVGPLVSAVAPSPNSQSKASAHSRSVPTAVSVTVVEGGQRGMQDAVTAPRSGQQSGSQGRSSMLPLWQLPAITDTVRDVDRSMVSRRPLIATTPRCPRPVHRPDENIGRPRRTNFGANHIAPGGNASTVGKLVCHGDAA